MNILYENSNYTYVYIQYIPELRECEGVMRLALAYVQYARVLACVQNCAIHLQRL